MGNNVSRQSAFDRLSAIIPPLGEYGSDEYWGKETKGTKVFQSKADRVQFIESIVSVLSRNGDIPVTDYDLKLFYTRNDQEELVAALVATKAGVIAAKIEPQDGGRNQAEAFKAFQKHVQFKLHEILQSVPDLIPGSTPARKSGVLPNVRQHESSSEAPPTYVESARKP